MADLPAAARGGDEAAFRLPYREVQPGWLRYVRGLVGPQDAEDVAAESRSWIARDVRSFREKGAGFRRWAAIIARHRAMDHLRHAQLRPAEPPDEVPAALPGRSDTPEPAITTNATNALMATLPRAQAEAVLLRAVMGLGTRAVTRVMRTRPVAVRTATRRGIRALAELVGRARSRQAAGVGV